MSTITKRFNKIGFGELNTVVINEEIWFLSNDIARILGYEDANSSHAIIKHTSPKDRKSLKYADGGKNFLSDANKRDRIFVNESGLYCLIFGSKKPEAEEFKYWVTHEVLPSIRKHGGYIDGQENLPADKQEELFKQIEKLQASVAAYKADGDDWIEMYERLQKDYIELDAKYNKLKASMEERAEARVPVAPRRITVVDGNGFVISMR